MTRYVQHDGARWKVVGDVDIDGMAGFELRRNVIERTVEDMLPSLSRVEVRNKRIDIIARASDCTLDTHQPKRVIRADGIVLTFQAGVVTIKEKGRRTGHTATLKGLYQALAWQAARNKARDRAFKRRTRGR